MLDLELNRFTAVILVAIFTIIYFIYNRFKRQMIRYESIEDNALMMAKLKAARLKQQENYNSQMIKEQQQDQQQKSREDSNKKTSDKNDDENSRYSRDFYPLMNSANSYYRPERKRPCGPCGGACG